ncbi:MAG TPA: rod shape-determining protein RodA [Thermodesulfovibrionales bacterium]|jgi:rod shape determining protein RodA|nr:rod shape-determining protein RodA [Thermodesulfovibrionales bacterium]
MKIDRLLLKNFDWVTLGLITALSVIGVMTIYSATRSPLSGEMPSFYIKQVYWLVLSILVLIAFVSFDYIWLSRLSPLFYGIGISLLVLVFFLGRTGMGAQRWLNAGIFSFQPSEVFKLIYVIAIARHLSALQEKIGLLSLIKMFLLLVALPLILIIKQPDLGTGVILLFVFLLVTAAKGLQKKVIALLIVLGLISVPFLGNIFWEGLKDYQKNRLVVFLEPDVDPSGVGYHINQSKVAIGSGKVFGKGYLRGTQGPFRFLPEKHTDFVFAVFAEEWGFAGSGFLLFLYLAFILRGLDTARKAKDDFGRLLAMGISLMFAVYFFVNIGMTLGIMPVVGVPLPFMSYGGTALLTNFIAAGVLINIRTRRFELFY